MGSNRCNMKKILIISPHFPPSNLAAVHRSRLFAQHLPAFGWDPYILMVHEDFYEEALDHNLEKLLPKDLNIEKAKAFGITKPRLIGDIGLRAFFQLYKRAKAIIKKEKIDFLYIPIPSFYVALLGRWLHRNTGVKYGIDYIDPWVHQFPGSDKLFSRHWVSTKIAKLLEPIAIKKASLITGVAEGYYQGVKDRNPALLSSCVFGAMPYGGEEQDHKKIGLLEIRPYLFEKNTEKLQMVYAGAMLPKAYGPLEALMKVIAEKPEVFKNLEIHFIGTGKTPNDPEGYNIKPMAIKYGLWQKTIFEYPKRIPYLDVLVHLNTASGIFILGSTEKHYTPSKVFQGILSGKPILALLHEESTAGKVVEKSGAGMVLAFNENNFNERIQQLFIEKFEKYNTLSGENAFANVDMSMFSEYSALNITGKLAELIKKALDHK